jgi:hypothetical protein
MESKNLLGIYFTKDSATVVCLASYDKGDNIPDCFTVTSTDTEQPKIQSLASLIAQGCSERKISFSEVAVAIDCSLFMQHNVHSEFSDNKQISATIRFDTEEALATDISEMALAFEINSRGPEGSNLTVFTAQKKILSEILLSLQQYNFDPITIKPDVSCLAKLIFSKIPKSGLLEGTMFGMLSDRSGYLVAPRDSNGTGSYDSSAVRTFIVGPKQNRTELLSREILMTTALFGSTEPVNSLRIFDSAGAVDLSSITERTGILAKNIELFGEPDSLAAEHENHVNRIDFAVAYGAALSLPDKEQTINFRDDFSPFQGKIVKTQKALKFTLVSVTVLLIAVGLYFHMNLFSVNKNIMKARAKLGKDYELVMERPLSKSDSTKTAIKRLQRELDALENQNAGIITTGTTISSKLTLVLKAVNKCVKQTELTIDSIKITENNIVLTGETSSGANTTTFFNVLNNTGLEIKSVNTSIEERTRRSNFSVTLEPAS